MSSSPPRSGISSPPVSRSSMPPNDDTIAQLDDLLSRAAHIGASDVHLEPKPDRLRIRLRVDGELVEHASVSPGAGGQLVSRIKVLAKLDISERRNPQDGMFRIELRGKQVSVRASTLPCIDGEKAVLRLQQTSTLLTLDQLGMTVAQARLAEQLISRRGGLVLTTGPAGSGKTSTLYALLAKVDTARRNVVTLEDPIELQLPDITQSQIQPKAGFTFASGLRSLLRQDPEVILVGEMRDEETASIAVQASLTGHMVLSTLHTSSSLDTIMRLIDIGLPPHTVAHALSGVIAQRLVRKPCHQCVETYELDRDVTEEVGFMLPLGSRLLRARGCVACLQTGYRGRTGIYEVLPFSDRLRSAIKRGADTAELKQLLRELGVPTLRRAGMALALHGGTTPGEVLRVT